MNRRFIDAMIVLLLMVGVSVLLYPTISDWWNRQVQTQAIIDYESAIASMDGEKNARMIGEAQAYNAMIAQGQAALGREDSGPKNYNEVLAVSGAGLMGYLVVDAIDIKLPIYHGTSEGVLAQGVGHLQGTSLPIGGVNSHAVMSAHTGLPSSKLFSDLNELEIGDRFEMHVLDRVLTYEVNQIKVVLPHEVNDLRVVEGRDFCTLFTCTPYGINSHRLLVRGERVAVKPETFFTYSQVSRIDPLLLWPFVVAALVITGAALVYLMRKKRRAEHENYQ